MRRIILLMLLLAAVQSVDSQVKFKEVRTAQDVLDNYISAIGGAAKISNIKSETITGDLEVQGMGIGFYVFRNDTMNFAKAEGTAHGKDMLMMKSLTTKSFAWEYQMSNIKEYEGEELLNKQLDLITGSINFVLNYNKEQFSFELKGSDTINGKLCYKLELTKDDKIIRTNYYDHESFYLIQYVKPNDVSIELSDYREVSGIYRPYKIIQKSQMELIFIFKEYNFNQTLDMKLLSKPTDN